MGVTIFRKDICGFEMKILVNFIVFILTLSTALSIEPFKQIKTESGKIHKSRYSEDRKTFMIIQDSLVLFYDTNDWSIKQQIIIPDSLFDLTTHYHFDVTTDTKNLLLVKQGFYHFYDVFCHYSLPDFNLLKTIKLEYNDTSPYGATQMNVDYINIVQGDYIAILNTYDYHTIPHDWVTFDFGFIYNISKPSGLSTRFTASEIKGKNSSENIFFGDFSIDGAGSNSYSKIDVFDNKGNILWDYNKKFDINIGVIDSSCNVILFENNSKIIIDKDENINETKLIEKEGYFYNTKYLADIIPIDQFNLYIIQKGDTLFFVDSQSFRINDKYIIDSYIFNLFYDSSSKELSLIDSSGTISFFKISKYTDFSEENSTLKEFSISPNPATDFIEISVGAGSKLDLKSDVKIYNVFGQTVFSVGAILELPSRIDVSGLAPGMYFVKISDKVSKFVKY